MCVNMSKSWIDCLHVSKFCVNLGLIVDGDLIIIVLNVGHSIVRNSGLSSSPATRNTLDRLSRFRTKQVSESSYGV